MAHFSLNGPKWYNGDACVIFLERRNSPGYCAGIRTMAGARPAAKGSDEAMADSAAPPIRQITKDDVYDAVASDRFRRDAGYQPASQPLDCVR
ncbi:MAG: hypothetical protein NVV62_11115 [Terricaulis sp.]|nr:hypothetical protein [Terricaulis sp.]